jgi:hypothetical protein
MSIVRSCGIYSSCWNWLCAGIQYRADQSYTQLQHSCIFPITINQDKSTTPATLLCCFVVQFFFAHTTTECYTRAFFFLRTPSVRAPAHKLASLLRRSNNGWMKLNCRTQSHDKKWTTDDLRGHCRWWLQSFCRLKLRSCTQV